MTFFIVVITIMARGAMQIQIASQPFPNMTLCGAAAAQVAKQLPKQDDGTVTVECEQVVQIAGAQQADIPAIP